MGTRLWQRFIELFRKPIPRSVEVASLGVQPHIELDPQRRIAKVWIEEGCLICGACEVICPAVFTVQDTSIVRSEAAIHYDSQRDAIEEAKDGCCVEVIKIEYV